ncbi:hypothetical protein CYMTET_8314 [Cymbomonas tetramitiformis]|uniref:D-isomer specific 2-hydroxyacid dehydrogenase NAD-binding domain-containing protein n=1 Tax=Cymbomonas tetramitiformis TaxID=36881 RepID=A0AAE0LGL1_9CHLO|nr:hypothetical protein CYMTET_8314 [Cymbomonas tetramitiformis]
MSCAKVPSAILVDLGNPDWIPDDNFQEFLKQHIPDADIRCASDPGNLEDICMIALNRAPTALAYSSLPNLQLVQRVGAGVDQVLADPALPGDVRIARLKPQAPAREIVEFCIAYVFAEQRHLFRYHAAQSKTEWMQIPPRKTQETTIGVLGLGHIGAKVAATFSYLGFQVIGWSRSPKTLEGVQCQHGRESLLELLGKCDFVLCILPSTPDTVALLDQTAFDAMKPGATLINAGRGDLIVDDHLIDALNKEDDRPVRAILDVFCVEPLPTDHPFWNHPKITITPHVSGWHIDDGLPDVAENYHRLMSGKPLLHEVDRMKGY